MTNKKVLNTILAGAIAVSAMTFAAQSAQAMDDTQEKCYGVAKAGKNDCASSDGAHSCASGAKTDAAGTEWVAVPKGLCDKLVGGSLEPAAAEKK